MKKNARKNKSRSIVIVLVALVLAFCTFLVPPVQASGFNASYIQKLENVPVVDYKEYLDSSVMFPLPENVKDNDDISVIITVNAPNLMDLYEATDKSMSITEFAAAGDTMAKLQADIDAEKTRILGTLDEQQIKYTLGEDYNTLLSGFELVIKAKDFNMTCKSLGKGEGIIVGEVYNVAETKLVENTVNVYGTGIFNSSGAGYDGSGMVVAVLDTGLDSNHSAFSPSNFTSTKLGLTYEDVAKVIGQTKAYELFGGFSVDDVYINVKVPFGYDYADNDPDAYSTHNNHGTHVSGVIVGKDDTITGVAPNAQVVAMKVFSDVMDTARSTWILSALEDCVVLGVDVINMSLGTACGFSRESDEEILNGVYSRIREAGISMIVAASNSYSSAYGSEANGNLGLTSNPDTGTVGSPGTYEGVMSVASINGVETPYIKYNDKIIYFNESNTSAGKENSFFDTLLGSSDSKEMEFVLIPGVGRSADYTGMDVNGKIVLVRRGSNTFEEKAIIAQSQGAAGIIIYNNVSGDIKMNVGTATLAVCSISQDDGEMLAALGSGKLTISRDQTSGPFISDFSSWGPTPSLNIKPEITAHGGNILSSVTGGGYDRLSGTSMACPNLAGVVILLRQYVVENFPDIANNNVKVNEMVNKLMMSTADIAINKNGLPYAVRKQGAGLANLTSSLNTKAYITTYDKNGNAMDKTKLELGDDPSKTGVYTMKLTVTNFGTTQLSYNIGAYVMTEGVSETLTNAGLTTVTEEGYILSGAVISASGAGVNGSKVTVGAGQSVDVELTITLSDADKQYLNESFANGMYVEGYITLTATEGTNINMNIPYLAFYGDWTQAPMFDKDYYETNKDELDTGLDEEDKVKPDAYATRPIGGISEDYVSYLGSYYFLQDPKDMVISASRDYIALSNQEGSIHSLRFVWAGVLRGAEKIVITITDDTTGEVVFRTVDDQVRKSYGDGGSIYPANVEIEFDTRDYNLANNTEYTVRLVGYMDYGDGGLETNLKNTFEFPLVMDFEAPTLSDVEFYYEYDKTLKKNRLYAKAAIYDNHFAMSAQLGYVTTGKDENGNPTPELKAFEQYMTPVYSQRNSTTYVTFELTDYLNYIKEGAYNANSFVITCYDYALNYASYEVGLPDNYVDFYFEGLKEGLTLSPNEVYSLEPSVYPNTEWGELLEYTSSRPSVVRVVNNKLVAVSSGNAVILARDPQTNKRVTFNVTVLKSGDEGYRYYDKPVADVFRLEGYTTQKAYYQVSSDDKKLGDDGDLRFFEGHYSLEMYPSESVLLNYRLDAYFPNDTTVTFESSNESIVRINDAGVVTAVSEGFASVTVNILQDGQSTYYSESVSVEVKDPYITSAATLTHYFGLGGVVSIPTRLQLKEIGAFAFSNFEYVAKTEEELAFDDAESTKQWFIGDDTITHVIIPEGVEKINAYAFANLTALEEITLPSTLEFIEYGAFYGCTSLKKITFSSENNLKVINQSAFERCDLQGTLELPEACMISGYAFAGNQNLKKLVLSDTILSIGQYAFAGCKSLEEVSIAADKVKYGEFAFTGCKALTAFDVNAAVLPKGMFYECENLKTVNIGADVNSIGEYAFRDTMVDTFKIHANNKTFKVQDANYILSADGKTLVAVAPVISGNFTAANVGGATITKVGNGAFSHNTKITAVVLEQVTEVGDYGFGEATSLTSVTLGKLTSIGKYGFLKTGITQLPNIDGNTRVDKYAFSFTALKKVNIPSGFVIEEGVFSECTKLEEVTIGDNVTIGKFAFSVDKNNIFSVKSYTEGGKKYFYYEFTGSLKKLTIGKNAEICESAFSGAAGLEQVVLGENAKIGKMAFYNCSALKQIDLSKVTEIGDYAFSGDVYYVCRDDAMSEATVSTEGRYIYTYHAPMLTKVELNTAATIGEYTFSYCRQLKQVILGSQLTEIPAYAFAGCVALEDIDLSNVKTIGAYAFIEDAALKHVDLSGAEKIGEYAFVYCSNLASVKLNAAGVDIDEAAFSYCEKLSQVERMNAVKNVGSYAFAYTALVEADLSGAEQIGDFAFMKETLTPFKVTLSENIKSLGDNPFAMCKLEPFFRTQSESFNGVDYESVLFTFQFSDTVKVVDGSLYSKVPNGWELIVYAGIRAEDTVVAEDTVRITAMAFAGSDVQLVKLPHTVAAIGHKAFYQCNALKTIVFTSYNAPVLEEEFDPTYYESLEHIPGTGDYGSYNDYDGSEVVINGMGLLPYFMWNASGSMYSNVFYGANFVDYVGYVEQKLTMVRPSNGQGYETFIMDQYFDLLIDGSVAADDVTLAAIAAINKLPERVVYEDKALVEAARAAYNKVATFDQRALVSNYNALVSAEQRILALTPDADPEVDDNVTDEPVQKQDNTGVIVLVVVLCVLAAAAGAGFWLIKTGKLDISKIKLPELKLPAKKAEETQQDDTQQEDNQ